MWSLGPSDIKLRFLLKFRLSQMQSQAEQRRPPRPAPHPAPPLRSVGVSRQALWAGV